MFVVGVRVCISGDHHNNGCLCLFFVSQTNERHVCFLSFRIKEKNHRNYFSNAIIHGILVHTSHIHTNHTTMDYTELVFPSLSEETATFGPTDFFSARNMEQDEASAPTSNPFSLSGQAGAKRPSAPSIGSSNKKQLHSILKEATTPDQGDLELNIDKQSKRMPTRWNAKAAHRRHYERPASARQAQNQEQGEEEGRRHQEEWEKER